MGFQDVRLNSKDLPNKLILQLKNNWEESLKTEPGFNDLRNFSGSFRLSRNEKWGRLELMRLSSVCIHNERMW